MLAENQSAAEKCECQVRMEAECSKEPLKSVIDAIKKEPHNSADADYGKLLYTCCILGMFAFIILLLMVRSIRRSRSTVEMEALLDAMRFREELDIKQRERKKLQKAKNKVSAWLSKSGEKMWRSSPQIIVSQPNSTTPIASTSENHGSTSVRSSVSFVPKIVVTENSEEQPFLAARRGSDRSYAPSLSLIYDFNSPETTYHSSCSLEIVDDRLSPSLASSH
ncbi:hypothetical protein L596_002597 [Steinernema carpocapsae]|uniref:Uncharacterized protein n=1 Tax=Steinernema carpocapsae TaxID=34508 RepID=A0A4U8USL2_STECR|nr:hypothetical protein L596_002597 [Steinernema carpocapsae]